MCENVAIFWLPASVQLGSVQHFVFVSMLIVTSYQERAGSCQTLQNKAQILSHRLSLKLPR